MLKLKNILKKLSKLSLLKKVLALGLLLAVLAPATQAVWGPQRPSFDWNTPEGKKGSTTGPVFNSMKNTPNYGDEFNFTTAKKASEGDDKWGNDLKVVAGDEVNIRVYIHNNGNQDLNNDNGLSVAKDVRAGIDLPQSKFSTKKEPIGFVNASNSNPKEVFDSTTISSADGKNFKLDYVEGSTTLTTIGTLAGFKDGVKLSDNFVSPNGTLVGSNKIDGVWKGCYEYLGWVVIKAKVVGETVPAPAVEIEKSTPSGKVNVNDEFPYTVKVTNTGNVDLTDVKVDDPAPANVTFSRVDPVSGITFNFSPSRVQATIASLKIGESKSFVIIAKVTKYVPTQIINTACVNAKEVNPEEPEKNDDCASVPVTPSEYCIVPGKEHLPKDDERCKVPLPSTGPGSTLLMVAATVALAAGAYLTSLKLAKRKS